MKQLIFMKRSKKHLLVFPFLLLLAAGCSSGGGEMTSADKVDDGKPKAPVKLKVLFRTPG